MRVYFLHHSAICVIIGKSLLIFDYHLHAPNKHMEDGHISKEEIDCFERVYVFVSHSHHDHFNPIIFDWASPQVTFILDSTVKKAPEGAVVLSPGKTYSDGTVFVREFGSTDLGGSFYVNINGTSFFHAGDLNDWHWKNEGNKRYTRVMKKMFDREMAYLKEHVAHIDYAFFPVDKRMGQGHDAGVRTFINNMKPDVLIPIHFLGFADTQELSESMTDGPTKVLSVHHMGERLV